jgi:hypothetical protein
MPQLDIRFTSGGLLLAQKSHRLLDRVSMRAHCQCTVYSSCLPAVTLHGFVGISGANRLYH